MYNPSHHVHYIIIWLPSVEVAETKYMHLIVTDSMYSETWELRTPKGV